MPWEKPLSDGPEVPPLTPGLPHTPVDNLRELLLAAVTQGLSDDDERFVCSPWFIHLCCYIGLDPDAALNVKIAYLRGEVDPKRLTTKYLQAPRAI